MKKTILTFLFIVLVQYVNALNIQQLTLTQGTGNNVNVSLKVTEGSLIIYNNYSYTLENNIITLIVCYDITTLSSYTTLDNEFSIENINTTTSNYTLIVYVNYRRWVSGQAVCDFTTNSDTATMSFSAPLTQAITLSSNFFNSDRSFVLFPNPTTGQLELKNSEQPIHSIFVYDNLGRLVKKIDSIGNNLLNLEDLENGIYIFELNTEREKFTRKIVVKK